MLLFDSVFDDRLHVAASLDHAGQGAMDPNPMSDGADRAVQTAVANYEGSMQ